MRQYLRKKEVEMEIREEEEEVRYKRGDVEWHQRREETQMPPAGSDWASTCDCRMQVAASLEVRNSFLWL